MTLPSLQGIGHWLEDAPLPERLAVGYSGGADSTALLLALAMRGHRVVAWHVDHAWHADSVQVSDALQERALAWGIEFHRVRLSPEGGRNREARARKARFEQFARWSAEQGIDTLCLAQHRDDQAETVCMRLLQGAGPAGCSGMRAERLWKGVRIVRPLLHIGRDEIRQVLEQGGVAWHEDASNADTSLLRNHIRHNMFAAVRSHGTDPAALFCRWQAQAARLSARLDALADSVAVKEYQGAAVLEWHAWQSSPAAVRAVLLQRMHARLFGDGAVLGRRHILLAEAWRKKGGRQGIDLSRCRLFRHRENLHLAASEVSLPDGSRKPEGLRKFMRT